MQSFDRLYGTIKSVGRLRVHVEVEVEVGFDYFLGCWITTLTSLHCGRLPAPAAAEGSSDSLA